MLTTSTYPARRSTPRIRPAPKPERRIVAVGVIRTRDGVRERVTVCAPVAAQGAFSGWQSPVDHHAYVGLRNGNYRRRRLHSEDL